MERNYIRVVGQARYDDSKPFIVAFTVQPIIDPNEIITHFLEVIADSLILEKRLNETLNSSKIGPNTSIGEFNQDNSNLAMSGFSEIQRRILDILNKYGLDSPVGLKRYEIKNYIPSVNSNVIDEAINFLVNEGHIFSTIDDDTFKVADAEN